MRHDRIDAAGVITIRYPSRLHHIGLSKHLRGTNVIVLIDDLDIRVLNHNTGTLIRKLTLDPTRDYPALAGTPRLRARSKFPLRWPT